ncbi:ABC transporter permease [Paludibaculum fermentans]|uniref:ABC transporter permease n=1 Tax=Paludibaculum fermentans TaxID=1473598 RepID=UPI003EBF14BB
MPDWQQLIREQLASLQLQPEREEEIVEEFAQHAEDRYRELRSGGQAEAEAVRITLEELSGRETLASELRSVERREARDRVLPGSGLWRDVRYGFRSLRNSLGFSLVVIGVLGIGIGSNVAMFTVVDAAFLRPLRLPEPERLVQLQETPPSGGSMPVSYPNFIDWQKQSQSFEMMAIGGSFEETLRQGGGFERIRVGYVSADFHKTYGVPPALGRGFAESDDRAGAEPAVILSYRFWQTHFAGDPGVTGRTLQIDDQVWTIVGVAGSFQWHRGADVFVPITFGHSKYGLDMRENHSSTGVIARLKPGVSVTQARTEMQQIAAQLAKQYPGANGGNSASVVPLREFMSGGMRQPALLMFGAVGLLLLIACANVAGLLLARAAVRQREIAIRTALGASRLELVRQLLTESLLLALGSAVTGLVVARLSFEWLMTVFPAAENLGGIGLDLRVLVFSVAAAGLTAVLFGLAPAIQSTRLNVAQAIRTGGRASRGSAVRGRTRKLLVVGQVAMAVVLSIGAGLLVRSLLAAFQTDPGFRPEHVVAVPIQPPDRKTTDLSDNARLLRDVTDRLAATPGVLAVGAIDQMPFRNVDSYGDFYRDDRPVPAPAAMPNGMKASVTAGYFAAMGIPLLKGRLFVPADGFLPSLPRDLGRVLAYLRTVEMTAVINQTMARRFWPGEDPVGKTFRFGPPSLKGPRVRIIGVVGDSRQHGLDQPIEPQYYFSSNLFPIMSATVVVRTSREPAEIGSLIRAIVHESQPEAMVTQVETLETMMDRSLAGRRNNVLLLGLFSGIALLLAAFGLYATMAYTVAQRTQEMGLRMALGAAAGDVRGLVVREGLLLSCAGVALGLLAAAAGTRVLASMLYGVAAMDVMTYAGSALLMVVITLAASYVPAWRASRVDPMTALRSE